MSRVEDVLRDMAAAVSDTAEHAMATALAATDVARKSKALRALVAATEGAAAAGSEGESESEGASESDTDAEEDRKGEGEERAAEAEEAEAEEEAEKEAAVLESLAQASPAVLRRISNARSLRKLAGEIGEMQSKMRRLASSSPQLLQSVSVLEKEALFQQLAEVLRAAEAPVLRRWYREAGRGEEAEQAAEELEEHLAGWLCLARRRVAFLFHAADLRGLPVPSSLEARLLRQAALVDFELTAHLVRSLLLLRVPLFAPRAVSRPGGKLAELMRECDAAVESLNPHSSTPPPS
uniref:Uncharacterized protein n=2 Tax=Emiliania huxleyi TaxID=2903 RepID=A0A7S3WEX7_EMIHU